MSKASNTISPVTPAERILALDVLRGVALMGILIMNIQTFSMIEAAYFNPTAYGDLTGFNKWVWILSHIFADHKFMTIFSILFGAGIILMSNKAEAKNQGAASLHYRRMVWLIIIGMLHAYLLWYGDILVWYSLCALVIFLFRKISSKWLLIIGVLSISVASLTLLLLGWSLSFMPQDAYQELLMEWKPNAEIIRNEINIYQSGWFAQMEHRAPTAIEFHTFIFLVWALWRAGGLMLVGMALFKWNVLTAQRSMKFYFTLMGIGWGIGFPLVIYGVTQNFAANWLFDYSRAFGYQFNYWGSIFVSLGYIGAIMLICKSVRVKTFMQLFIQPFAAVGRMALTNYLLQTIICTTIFYGHGFGLFGEVERNGQILIVLLIWIFQLSASTIWLRYFRFGPFEWLWRSLTYLKLQPMQSN